MKNQFIVWAVLVFRLEFLLGVKTLLAREYGGIWQFCMIWQIWQFGMTAQLVEQRTGNAEVTGSNPLKPWFFFFQASSFQLLKLENSLRWSFFTLSSVYIVTFSTESFTTNDLSGKTMLLRRLNQYLITTFSSIFKTTLILGTVFLMSQMILYGNDSF